MKRSILAPSLLLLSLASLAPGQEDAARSLFLVYRGNAAGYIDQTGKIVIPPRFESATDFREDRACAASSGKKYALIDTAGQFLTTPQFSACHRFSDGRAAVAFPTEKTRTNCSDCDPFYHWGYIDRDGALIVAPRYHTAGDFSEGLAAVENDSGKWGFVDRSGRVAIDFRFDYAESFSEGLALVVIRKRYGYINHSGEPAIAPRFKYARSFSEGLALVRQNGKFSVPSGTNLDDDDDSDDSSGVFEYIENTGRTTISFTAEHASDFSEGLAEFGVIKKDGYLSCGYMNRAGKAVIGPKFGFCDDFSEGLASVHVDGNWHFIDKTGNFVINLPNGEVRSFHRGLAWVSQGTQPDNFETFGYIDKSGKLVWDPRPQK
ncbi:MAG TPA: WG repeat-containing protein [Candidatus Dormibacteraeota bacterium]|nr:WG repeat-containing protein [Candidatus Dormibacteraeota bacterium]